MERFHHILDTLGEYPGEDELYFIILDNHNAVKLKMPGLSVNYCPELHQKLDQLVGESGLTIEEIKDAM
jgi:hypothetical protein